MRQSASNLPYSLAYRPDIDGLRALAVGTVILFHAFPHLLPSGFIGVDIFFVISGYLITGILLGDLQRSQWSIYRFYSRRILRIFPALLIVLLFCLVLGYFLLLADEYGQLGKHIATGMAFVSNFSLWLESGYFDGASDHKLLLHLWSLAIEEQFYLAWPLLLWLAWRVNQVALFLVLACALSFIANTLNIGADLFGTFYLPWYRFWELGIGGLLVYIQFIPKTAISSNRISLLGLVLLLGGFILIDRYRLFPGWWALLPTIGTALVIAAGPYAFFNKYVLSHRVMVWLGLISFPMYLWHWPLLTFSRLYWAQPSVSRLIITAVLSIPLAYLTYHFIEKPIRFHQQQAKLKVILLMALGVGIGLIGLLVFWSDGAPNRNLANKHHRIESDLKWNYWDNKECIKLFDVSPCQMTLVNPKNILIMGDSHANQLYPGIAQHSRDLGVLNLGSCPPLDEILVLVSKNQEHNPGSKDNCIKNTFQIINRLNSISTVIISTYSLPLLDGKPANQKDYDYWGNVTLRSNLPAELGLNQQQLLENGLLRTLKRITALNKEIIFVRNTPTISEDLRDYCIKRNVLGAQSMNCTIPRVQYESQRAKEAPLIKAIELGMPNVKIFDPLDIFCDQTVCYLIKDGRSLYRDHNHLSEYGSSLIGREIGRQYLNN